MPHRFAKSGGLSLNANAQHRLRDRKPRIDKDIHDCFYLPGGVACIDN